jgi:frataxin-like iron-binding protein CyaY
VDNVLIEINKRTRQVFLTNSVIGNDGENLQEKLVFSFNDEFVNGTARLELIKPDKTKSYIMLTKVNETYEIPVKSIITKGGRLTMQLVITQGTDPNAIPIFKSNKFYVVVNSSINFLIEEPDEYPQWIDVANTKLNEIDEAIQEASNLDIDVNKEDNVATITLTDKEGQTKEVQILDGERGPQGIQGPVGPAGADGKDGKDGTNGQNATINGVNTLNIEAGENITLQQEGNTLTINSSGGGEVTSVNGQTGDVVINVPDVSNFITKDVNNLTYYELKTAVGNSIVMSIDSSTYVLSVSLKNSAGTVLNTQTVDLPLETMVVGGSYDSTNKKIILTLKNGQTIEFSVADLVSGLQSEITSNNKLSADLVDDTNTTNKFVSASDKTTWNAKYDKPSGGIPSTDLASGVQTSLGKADTAIQNTDYASGSNAGVVKTTQANGFGVSSGVPYAYSKTYQQYGSSPDTCFIGKATLENIITGKGLLDSTKVKNTNSTTAGDVYDVRYINSLIGDINTILATLTTPSSNVSE